MIMIGKLPTLSSNRKLPKNVKFIVSGWIVFLVIILLIVKKYQACQDRIPITYLMLGFCLASFVALEYLLQIYQVNVNLIVSFLFAIALLVATQFSTPNTWMKTVLFALFIIAMSLILQPLFRLADRVGIAKPALLTVCLWFMVLTVVSIFYPQMITPRWGNILFFSLVALLLVRIVMMFTRPTSKMVQISAYIGIVIFSGYVLYDSKLMRQKANQCKHPYDFIDNLLKLFLNFVNLWSDTMAVGVTSR